MMTPFITRPTFRGGTDTPWGGSALRGMFGKDTPDERTGESLEVSALAGFASRDSAGVGLDEMIRVYGADLVGDISGAFPLLLKLIDARERLSVQVHPDDAYAAARENGKLGKTEAWVILSAKPGARLIYGLAEGVSVADFSRVIRREDMAAERTSRIEACLNSVPVKPGDVFYIPAGTVHAIGEGILVYEIQQSSDVTYRLWDWGRTDAQGRGRQLHIDDALAVMNPGGGGAMPGVTSDGGARTVYIEEPYFTLERLSVRGRAGQHAGGRFAMLSALDGGSLSWQGGGLIFKPGDTIFVPASSPKFDIHGNCDILKSYPTAR